MPGLALVLMLGHKVARKLGVAVRKAVRERGPESLKQLVPCPGLRRPTGVTRPSQRLRRAGGTCSRASARAPPGQSAAVCGEDRQQWCRQTRATG